MKFKRKILGLAVASVVTTFSATAISDPIPTPEVFTRVDAAPVAATVAGVRTKDAAHTTLYDTVATVRQDLADANTDLAIANKNVADNATDISTARSKIAAANLLTAGQLIGGKTKAEIVTAQLGVLGETAAGVAIEAGAAGAGLLADTSGLVTIATNKSTAQAAAANALATLETGNISAHVSTSLAFADQASTQTDLNGTVNDAMAGLPDGGDSLGALVKQATGILGTAETAAGAADGDGARGTYDRAVDTAAAAVTAAAGNLGTDVFAGSAYAVDEIPGEAPSESFTSPAAGEVLDIRDATTQTLITVGADNAATVASINAAGLNVVASDEGATIKLTYKDGGATTIVARSKLDEAKLLSVFDATDLTADLLTPSEGVSYVAQEEITYDMNIARANLAVTEALNAVNTASSNLILAQSNFDSGVETATSASTGQTAALKAAADAWASVDQVLQEELAVKLATVAANEKLALADEDTAATDLQAVADTAAALETATAAEAVAITAVEEATAAFQAEGGATLENAATLNQANTAKNAATAVKNAAQLAATSATNTYYGDGKTAATVIDAQDGSNKAAVTARKLVVTSQAAADAVSAQRDTQVQLAADASNPATVLQAALVEGGADTGGALVTAVNSNHQSTVVNATGIAANVATLAVHEGLVTTNIANIATNTTNIATNTGNIATNTTNIATNTGNIATNTTNIATNTGNIATNTTNIATNTGNIASNTASIADLSSSLADSTANLQRVEMQLNDDVDMLKSGIASALAIAGMPTAPGEGMGFSIGTGYYDGESAIAMGLTYVEGNRSYKFSLGNSGGETSASAGAAFKF